MPALDDVDEFLLVVGDAAAGPAQGEGRPDDRGQAYVVEDGKRLRQGFDLMRARRRKADLGHRLAEKLAILGLVDRLGALAPIISTSNFSSTPIFSGTARS